MIYQWFKVQKNCCNVYFHVLSSASLELQTERAVFACVINYLWAPPDWVTALWVTREQAHHWSQSGALTISLVNTTKSFWTVSSESGLVPAGWGWQKSATPWWHHTERKYETRQIDSWKLRLRKLSITFPELNGRQMIWWSWICSRFTYQRNHWIISISTCNASSFLYWAKN